MAPERRLVAVLLVGLFLMLATSAALGKTFWVAPSGIDASNAGTEDNPFATIRYALTRISASVRDTINVTPGVYYDSLMFDSRAVVVRGLKGAHATIIDGSEYKTAVVFEPGTPTTTIFGGFTVRGATERGIYVRGYLSGGVPTAIPSSPEIKGCIIRGNGTGIRLDYSAANIHNNLIDSNAAGMNGSGILSISSSPTIWNNRIEYNQSKDGMGGGLYLADTLDGRTTIIQNNLIIGNFAQSQAGGVYLSGDNIYFANNLVYGNRSPMSALSGGMIVDYGINLIIANNIVVNNYPFGVYCYGSSVFQANCFFGNLPATQVSMLCPTGTGNYDLVDPQFIDSAGGKFYLQPTSPLINAGVPPASGALEYDFDGFPRVSGNVDVGPYERTTCNMIPDFTAPKTPCAGQPIQFQNTSGGFYVASIWDFGNGDADTIYNVDPTLPIAAPTTVYKSPGDYTVTVRLFCPYADSVATSQNLTVNARPVPAFVASVNQGCAPLTVNFMNTSSGGSRTDYWDFGDGIYSSETSPSHVFISPGTWVVKLVCANACGADSISDTITVQNAPVASFSSDVTRGSAVLPVVFTGTATNDPTGWLWNFGDGGTATTQTAQHNYPQPGIYSVSLTATNACGQGQTFTRNDYITVYGFDLRQIDSDTTNRLQQKVRMRLDTLYGLFSNNIVMSGTVIPTPRRGSASVTFSRTTARALDTVTATAILSRDLAAGTYQLRAVAQSVFNSPADTLLWSFRSRPDTLIKVSAYGIDFDSVQVDSIATDSIKLQNTSGLSNPLNLRVTNIVSTDSQFVILDTASGTIQPNGSFYVRVKLKPSSIGEKSAFLTIYSDDPALPEILITLHAVVIPEQKPPTVVSTSPANDGVGILIGSSVDLTLSEAIESASLTSGTLVVRSRARQADLLGTTRLLNQTRVSFVPQQRFLPYDTIDVRLKGTVSDRAGNTLDGDRDGKGEGSPADDYTFRFVTGPAVYPGDCNNDGRVNEIDVLPLGVFYGSVGPRRDSLGEETGWGPKQAVEWSEKRATYADADGNGEVNAADLLIIALNWGGVQPSASSLYPSDFDYHPYAAGLAAIREALGSVEGSDAGNRIVQLLNNYVSSSPIPRHYELSQNYPNPFNPTTQIGFAIPLDGRVTLTVHNVIGQTVKVIVDGLVTAGYHSIAWDGRDQTGTEVASGIYFYRLEAADFTQIRKMVKLR